MTLARPFIVALVLAGAIGCASKPKDEPLSLEVVDSSGVVHVERLTDGQRALEGAPWNSDTAAFFEGNRAFVTFDLGRVSPIDGIYLQGDNNDTFILESSEDGAEFDPLWTASAVDGAGHRGRWHSGLGRRARFVRLRSVGGDAFVSATELQLFASKPSSWPPRIRTKLEFGASVWAPLALVLFGSLAFFSALLHRRDSKTIASMAWWAATGVSALLVALSIAMAWPPEPSVINVSRAVSAFVACAVVLRLGFRPTSARSSVLTGLLAAMAFLSMASFYNFGHPQFYDLSKLRPSYVHTWDMRVYFPAAKYFDELGYDGVYLASVEAYAEDELGGSLEPIKDVQLRDLHSYDIETVEEAAPEIRAIKGRFSAQRWTELKKDMSYFWKAMGRQGYLGSLRDHGANATPAWMVLAHWIFRSASADETTLLWTALLDPALLLLFFVVAWRTFGLRPALVCLVAYGATTIYQFGSNWGGSTLRNDWMVLLGLGVCALKAKRPFVGGVLLGWSAMIRAFPVLALAFLVAPVGWRLLARWRARKREELLDEAPARASALSLAKAMAGAMVVVAVLGVASAATFGVHESWGVWSDKIALHAAKPNVNHLGIRALVGYKTENLWDNLRARGRDPEQWGPLTAQTVEERRWMITLGMLFFTLLALLACRSARLSDAAVIGTMMIPVYLYPANYYLHILFLWPLLHAARGSEGSDRKWALIATSILACCVIQSFGWLIPGRYGQFLFWSGTLLAVIAVVLLLAAQGAQGGEDDVHAALMGGASS
ncbi:MAG: hypothetical protein PVH21_06535 [Myxococcales bacterium]|jgi:hypothetical protein